MKKEIWLLALGHQQLVLARYQAGDEVSLGDWWREDLPAETDEAILAAAGQLWQQAGQEAGSGKKATIFLVSPFWIKADGNLLESKKALLANLSRRFHLQPLGFLLADEVLIRHYQQERGQTPSFISVAVDNPSEISLIHLGKIKSRLRLEVGNDEKWPEQLEKVLGQLDYPGMFPPHFVFWGWQEEKFAGLRQECEQYVWTGRRDSLFLQIPQFDFLTWPQFLQTFAPVLAERLADQDEVSEPAGEEKQAEVTPVEPLTLELPAGFSHDDLALQEKPALAEEPAEEVGEPARDVDEAAGAELPSAAPKPESPPAAVPTAAVSRLAFLREFSWPRLAPRQWLGWGHHALATLAQFGLLTPLLITLGFFLLLLAANGWYFRRTLTIILTPQVVTVEKTLAANELPRQTISVELSESGQVPTTGQTTVGEKALGTVVIFNRLSHPLLLSSGTHLEATNGLTFALRESVKVASKTADLNTGVDKLGRAEASVVATKFGPEYNLPRDTIFKVDDYSQNECVARAKDDFSGGSNRQVPAVAKEDLRQLQQQLEKKILAKAEEAIRQQTGAGLQLVGDKVTSEVVHFDPQRHAGEEAEVVKGQLTMKIKAEAVSRQRLANLAQKLLRERAAASELEEESIQTDLRLVDDHLVLAVRGKVLPRLNLSELRQKLRGKTKAAAQKLVHHYPRVARLEISHQISIFNFWPWLPWRPEKIIIRVQSE